MWTAWVESLSEGEPKLYTALRPAEIKVTGEDELTLRYSAEDTMRPETARSAGCMKQMKAAMRERTGREIKIHIEQVEAEKSQTKKKKLSQEELIEKAKQDPVVQKALELFPGSTIESVEDDDDATDGE